MNLGALRQVAAGAGAVYGAQSRQSREFVYVGTVGIHPDRIETMVNGKKVEVRWDEKGPYVMKDIFKEKTTEDKEGGSYNFVVKVGEEKVYLVISNGKDEKGRVKYKYNEAAMNVAKFGNTDSFYVWANEVWTVWQGLKNLQTQSQLTDDEGKKANSVYTMINGEKYIPYINSSAQVVYLGDDGKWYRMDERASRNSGYDGGAETNTFSDFCFVQNKEVTFKKVIPQNLPRKIAARGANGTRKAEAKSDKGGAVGTYRKDPRVKVYCERQSGKPPKYYMFEKRAGSTIYHGDDMDGYKKVEIPLEDVVFFNK